MTNPAEPSASEAAMPYAEEINDDSETLCTCCNECEGDCAGDI